MTAPHRLTLITQTPEGFTLTPDKQRRQFRTLRQAVASLRADKTEAQFYREPHFTHYLFKSRKFKL